MSVSDRNRLEWMKAEFEMLLALASEMAGCQQDDLHLGHVKSFEAVALSIFKKGEFYAHESSTVEIHVPQEVSEAQRARRASSGTMPRVREEASGQVGWDSEETPVRRKRP
jgi:hypothetical protein